MPNPSRRAFLRQAAAGGFVAGLPLAGTHSSGMAAAAEAAAAPRWAPAEGPNQPLGQARGVCPGRVVWIHDPQVARWDGNTSGGSWYEDRFTDPVLADQMLSQSLRRVTDAKADADAWTALFRHLNQTQGRGDAA